MDKLYKLPKPSQQQETIINYITTKEKERELNKEIKVQHVIIEACAGYVYIYIYLFIYIYCIYNTFIGQVKHHYYFK